MRIRRSALLGIALALLAATPAAPARAATVSRELVRTNPAPYQGGSPENSYRFKFDAAPGEANRVTFYSRPYCCADATLRDDGASLTAGPGCEEIGDGWVRCLGSNLDGAAVNLGDGNDVANMANFFADVSGGAGDDQIRGERAIRIDGGPGADLMYPGPESTVSYADRTSRVVVKPDGIANDGESGEGDDVGPGVPFLIGGAGDDELHLADGPRIHGLLAGGAGDDRLFGAASGDRLLGGEGDDELHGGDGTDSLDGGRGADLVRGGGDHDTEISYLQSAGVTVSLDDRRGDGAPGENDDVGSDVEAVYGGDGGDHLIGSDGHNRLIGYGGDDVIEGRGGDDELDAGHGRNRVVGGAGRDDLLLGPHGGTTDTADGEVDTVWCGGASNFLSTDPFDRLTKCAGELVPPRQRRVRVRRDGTVSLLLMCSPEDIPCAGRLRIRRPDKLALSDPAVGRARFLLPADGSHARLAIRLASPARARLARRGRERVMVLWSTRRTEPRSGRDGTFNLVLLAPR